MTWNVDYSNGDKQRVYSITRNDAHYYWEIAVKHAGCDEWCGGLADFTDDGVFIGLSVAERTTARTRKSKSEA